MTKKQLYLVLIVFGMVVLYLLFKPEAVIQAPENVEESRLSEDVKLSDDVDKTFSQDSLEVDELDEPDKVVLKGTFVGLLEEIDRFDKMYKYLLLNDGSEILRIDLRPLIGYSDIDTIKKLGVERGDMITIIGVMNDGAFRIESIE